MRFAVSRHQVQIRQVVRADLKSLAIYDYYDTWREAHQALVGRYVNKLKQLDKQVKAAERALQRAERLKEPDASEETAAAPH